LSTQNDPWAAAILVAVFIGTPLAILPARVLTYDTAPKLVILCLGAALLFWFSNHWGSGVPVLWQTRPGRRFYLFLILAAISLVLSSLFSDQPWLSLTGTSWRRLGAIDQIVLFLIAAAMASRVYIDRNVTRTLMLAMEAAGAVASVYAILQYAGWDPLIPVSVYKLGSPPAVRPPATLTQATYFATFLLAPILIASRFRLRETSWSWKRSHEAGLCVMSSALVLSGTRAALLGLAAGACILLYAERSRFTKNNNLAKASLVAFALAAALALFVFSPAGKPVRARVAQWTADRAGGPRLLVWRDSLQLLIRHPLLGIGPERFEGEFRRIESLELARAFPDHYHESSHNFFLEIAISQGLIGLAVWLGLLALAYWSAIGCLRRECAEAALLCAALAAMFIALQFCPLTLTNELYLLALIAMSVALPRPEDAAGVRPVILSPKWAVLARVACLLPILIAGAYAEQTRLYYVAQTRASQGDLASAEHSYEAARKFPMPGPDLALSQHITAVAKRSLASERAAALRLARQAAEAASINSADRFNGFYQAAMVAMITGDIPESEANLRKAVNAAPTWYRPRMALASVLWWEGRNQEAQRETNAAVNCAGRMEPAVRRTLQMARAQASLAAGHAHSETSEK
jgi:O-antigen ligase